MIKPNETKTWPSGTAFNISELAVGLQLFSVWIHFPFINTSLCINKMKVALQNQKEPELGSRGGWTWPVWKCPAGLSHADFWRPAPSLPPEMTSLYKLKARGEFRCTGELTNSDRNRKDAERGASVYAKPADSTWEGVTSAGLRASLKGSSWNTDLHFQALWIS